MRRLDGARRLFLASTCLLRTGQPDGIATKEHESGREEQQAQRENRLTLADGTTASSTGLFSGWPRGVRAEEQRASRAGLCCSVGVILLQATRGRACCGSSSLLACRRLLRASQARPRAPLRSAQIGSAHAGTEDL
jgi:hypothetical protein